MVTAALFFVTNIMATPVGVVCV